MIADDVALLHLVAIDAATDPEATVLSDSGSTGLHASGDRLAPTPASAIGRRIGDYELLEELGRGGMGVVYRARHLRLQRFVALKMIPNAAFANPQDSARLRAEAMAAARLSHPNIVP
ncbi:MAG: hypothetical protein KDA85_03735, partial [Planctomycetaceae bacterium]|nr:hypothetical protein [Planctomycetaceae bacterium]